MRKRNWLHYALLFLVVTLFAGVRWRMRNLPLERDEGEYAYVGQLMLDGIPPYKLAYTMKLPGTHAAYAAMMAVLGQTPAGIHIGLMLMNAATMLLIYRLAVRFSGRLAGLVAGASYGLLSTSFSVLGFAAHATHFVVFAAMAGISLLLHAIEVRRAWLFFASGVLLGLAFLMKQPGIFFVIFGGLYLLKKEWPRPDRVRDLLTGVGSYVFGALLPFGITCLILYITGVFGSFRFWVFTYAGAYGSQVGLGLGTKIFKESFPNVVGSAIGVWLLAAVGLTALAWHRQSRPHAAFAGGLLLFSFLAVCPGFFFRQHYFILVLPAVALLAGIGVQAAAQTLARGTRGSVLAAIPVSLFLAAFGWTLFRERSTLFEKDPLVAFQKHYGSNPFQEAIVIAQYLNAHTSANDRIAVLGSEPEIYFYAHRHSATGFIYMYGLMEQQEYSFAMQKQMISEVESERPKFLVAVLSDQSWLGVPGSPQVLSLSTWSKNYLASAYERVGAAHRNDDHAEYRWDNEAQSDPADGQTMMRVLKRKN